MLHSLRWLFLLLLALPLHAATDADSTRFQGLIGTRAVDLDGGVHRLGLAHGLQPVVLVFLDTGCPISARYAPQLNDLHQRATEQGLEFYGILSDPDLTPAQARQFQTEYNIAYPLLFDSVGDLAARLQPAIVPEAFAVDREDALAYRGRIDDHFFAIGKPRRQVTAHDLRDAIDALAQGRQPSVTRTEPVGCFFEAWSQGEPTEVTYAQHIAPILNANCVECHRRGGSGPFPLENGEQAQRRAQMTAYVVESGIMPPWRAEPGFGHFRDQRFLSQRQIDLIVAWADGETALGDSSLQLPPPALPTSSWRLGEPDLVFTMAEPFAVPAEGEDIYRYFILTPKLDEDVVITAMDFIPGDPTVVHHMNSFVDYTGRARKKDKKDAEPGFAVFGQGGSFFDYSGGDDGTAAIGGWAPGVEPYQMPSEHGIYLPKGGELVVEIHYHLTGRAATDQSRLGIYLAKEPVKKYLDGLVIGTQDIEIPPGQDDYVRHFWMKVPADLHLIDAMPHMHYLGKSMKAIATLPDGSLLPLISIPEWDLRWQNIYTFRQPLFLPKGSRIDAWFHFDNSADNPYNPHNPPQAIKWGWGTDEEIAEIWLGFVPKKRRDSAKIQREGYAAWYRSAKPSRPEPQQ